ncbi:MAG: efflux RND transporter periplasmic adaptor subunit [Acidobacteria bacterium]|nr:efflux RND transporter periplasmic adaptor subunit [Acidobacteriota bacterium]
MKFLSVRVLKWLAVPVVAAVTIYWIRFAPVAAIGHTVATTDVSGETLGTGTLEARLAASISPRLTGRLTAVLVDQGDRVTAGQLLATLDDVEARRHLEAAEAGSTAAAATTARIRTDEARAAAVLKRAQLEHARAVSLADSRSVAESERDKATEQLRIAEADLARGRAAIAEAVQAEAAAARQVALQQELLAHTRLVAPFAGLVARRDRHPGDVVTPGSTVLHLIATEEIWVSAWVDETAIARLAPGQPARVVFRAEPDTPYPGRVARLGRETDRETREFLVDVRVDRLPANWTLGQRAEVYIETGRRAGVVSLPPAFLFHRNGVSGTWVQRDGRARWQPIEPGLRGATLVEIRTGLKSGDRVVRPAVTGASLEGRRLTAP